MDRSARGGSADSIHAYLVYRLDTDHRSTRHPIDTLDITSAATCRSRNRRIIKQVMIISLYTTLSFAHPFQPSQACHAFDLRPPQSTVQIPRPKTKAPNTPFRPPFPVFRLPPDGASYRENPSTIPSVNTSIVRHTYAASLLSIAPSGI